MFGKKATIENTFKTNVVVSSRMENAIDLWSRMYEGNPPWLKEGIQSLNLPAAIASEIARLVTMEMEVKVTGSPMADYLQKQLDMVLKKSRQYTEQAVAKGGIILKPYIVDTKIGVSIIQSEDFYPTKFDTNGDVVGAIFLDQKIIENKKYTRLEQHDLDGTTYTITNKVFVTNVSELESQDESILGKEIELKDVPGWEDVQPVVTIHNVEQPFFSYFKMPMSNNIEIRSPLGVSAYAKATDVIREVDVQWSNILWEYQATQAAVFGDEDMFTTDRNGNITLEGREKRLFRTFQGLDNGIKEYSPVIRDQSLFNGLDKMLKQVEFLCGLSYGTLSNPAETDKTATEVKQSKQRSFALVSDIQKKFQEAHEHLVKAMHTLAILYGLAPYGEYETMFNFDDSIVVDREVEFARLMQMALAGMIKPEAVTAWYFNIDEEEAAKMLPATFDDTEQPQEDEEEE